MPDERFDVIVVGGGPGGSTISTLIAARGHKVLLLEREKHPRYQIGESTLPYTLGICKVLGLGDELAKARFTKKLGGEWRWGTQRTVVGVDFREVVPQPLIDDAYAYQVERSKFDKLLFDNAVRNGVDAREQHLVDELIEDGGRIVGARYLDANGHRHVGRSSFVVDAGGHTSPFHRHCGQRIVADRFRNFALFCYFRGGKRLPAPLSGSILNVTFRYGWFWYIPLSPTLTSVGAVVPIGHADLLKDGHEQAMQRFIDECPDIKELLSGAPRVTEGQYGQYRVRKDWSYLNTGFWRSGLVLIGDAACFIDPLFSTGVHLSTYSALLAARSLNSLLALGDKGVNEQLERLYLAEFEARYRSEYAKFYQFLSAFYDANAEKEEYFRTAHAILQTKEDAYKAFVRLVSGWSSADGVASASSRQSLQDGSADLQSDLDREGSSRSLSDKSFGGAFAESESDIFNMAIGTVSKTSRHEGLVPTKDGLGWEAG